MAGELSPAMAAEFDTVAEWTAQVAADLGPDYYIPAACRGSGRPSALDWLLAGLDPHSGDVMIDIGAGLPTQGNTHDLVQQITPGARVVYVDNDPMVLAHGTALLGGSENTKIVMADLRDPGAVLNHPDLRALIDLGQAGGGGGYGDPHLRPRSAVRDDLRRGYISRESAVRDYGMTEEDLNGS